MPSTAVRHPPSVLQHHLRPANRHHVLTIKRELLNWSILPPFPHGGMAFLFSAAPSSSPSSVPMITLTLHFPTTKRCTFRPVNTKTIHDNRSGSLGHAACNRHDRPDEPNSNRCRAVGHPCRFRRRSATPSPSNATATTNHPSPCHRPQSSRLASKRAKSWHGRAC